jgi:hypothetical protein
MKHERTISANYDVVVKLDQIKQIINEQRENPDHLDDLFNQISKRRLNLSEGQDRFKKSAIDVK